MSVGIYGGTKNLTIYSRTKVYRKQGGASQGGFHEEADSVEGKGKVITPNHQTKSLQATLEDVPREVFIAQRWSWHQYPGQD